MDDDVYPNDSYYIPREPKEQRLERKRESAKVLEMLDFLKEHIERLDKRIKFYESVHSIPNEVKADPEAFLIMHNANEQTALSLKSERDWLASFIPANK